MPCILWFKCAGLRIRFVDIVFDVHVRNDSVEQIDNINDDKFMVEAIKLTWRVACGFYKASYIKQTCAVLAFAMFIHNSFLLTSYIRFAIWSIFPINECKNDMIG